MHVIRPGARREQERFTLVAAIGDLLRGHQRRVRPRRLPGDGGGMTGCGRLVVARGREARDHYDARDGQNRGRGKGASHDQARLTLPPPEVEQQRLHVDLRLEVGGVGVERHAGGKGLGVAHGRMGRRGRIPVFEEAEGLDIRTGHLDVSARQGLEAGVQRVRIGDGDWRRHGAGCGPRRPEECRRGRACLGIEWPRGGRGGTNHGLAPSCSTGARGSHPRAGHAPFPLWQRASAPSRAATP